MPILTDVRRGLVRATRALLRWRPDERLPTAVIATATDLSMLASLAVTLSRRGAGGTRSLHRRLLALYDVNEPGLFVHVQTDGRPCRLVLTPWDRDHVTLSGRDWHLMTAAESAAQVPAFVVPAPLRTHRLYETAPTMPLFVASVAHGGELEMRGSIPPYVTHLTVQAGAREIAVAQRVRHDRGAHVFQLSPRAA